MARPIGPRRLPLLLPLAAAVLLAHLAVGERVAGDLAEVGPGLTAGSPRRLTATFTRELRPEAPPAEAVTLRAPAPGAPSARRSRSAAPPPAAAASAASASSPAADEPAIAAATPASAAIESERASEPLPPALSAPAETVAAAEPAASEPLPFAVAASASGAASAAAVAVDWPLSTRLSYRLTGDYRGPVDGQASVEWLREGSRYQVHLEVSVGPSFAPLVSRRMSSDGEIGPEGLTPRRYEEVTHVALRSPRLQTVAFDGAQLRLANGSQQAQPPGVQDTASQFVQLTWLFTTQPQRLNPGESVAMPLALPRRLDVWVYDVLAHEQLHTPAGIIDTVHVRPRRPARPDGELAAEVWIAPSLQYLPVRIVIRQDAQTYVDLLLQRLPQQAAQPAQR